MHCNLAHLKEAVGPGKEGEGLAEQNRRPKHESAQEAVVGAWTRAVAEAAHLQALGAALAAVLALQRPLPCLMPFPALSSERLTTS